jgi:hypothetical protein
MKKRGTGKKVTLGEVAKDDYLTFRCKGTYVATLDCRHNGQMEVDEAIEKWGADVRLDELPIRCSKCGGKTIDVRSDYYKGLGGLPEPRSKHWVPPDKRTK